MEESPVDLSEITWLSGHRRPQSGGDADHRAQLSERERQAAARRAFGEQRDRLIDVYGSAGESTRSLLALIGSLVHDLTPVPSVRHRSEVRHLVWRSFADLTDAVGRLDPLVMKSGRARLRCGPGCIRDDPRRYEADGRLHLPASRPDLPVRLVIEPWWANRSAVTLGLRPSHRWRYPRRYFDAAHGVVSELTASS